MANILIIKLGSLGDMVQISGAIRDISEYHKDDEVHLLLLNHILIYLKKIHIFLMSS